MPKATRVFPKPVLSEAEVWSLMWVSVKYTIPLYNITLPSSKLIHVGMLLTITKLEIKSVVWFLYKLHVETYQNDISTSPVSDSTLCNCSDGKIFLIIISFNLEESFNSENNGRYFLGK